MKSKMKSSAKGLSDTNNKGFGSMKMETSNMVKNSTGGKMQTVKKPGKAPGKYK